MSDSLSNRRRSTHCLSIDLNDKRRSSCCSCCDATASPLNLLEQQTFALTPPLDNIFFEADESQPFTCIYLLNLFLAPDARSYLAEASISDDVYKLPIQVQKLICEARMEVLLSDQSKGDRALKRLERLRTYVNSVAHNDTAAVIATLNEIMHNEDELLSILGE
jgi:hypothetical protein